MAEGWGFRVGPPSGTPIFDSAGLIVPLSGFDVSMYQSGAYSGGGGFSFGIAKLTEGVGYKDPAADQHMAAILAQPIVPGGYQFSRPDLNPGTSGAYAEADWFWRVATSYGGARGMLLADDAESAGGSAQWCDDFRGRLAWRLGGYQALFYSYLSWMQTRGIIGSAVLSQSALWFAWPDSNGDFPPGLTVSMQQYGLVAVPGISGQVDANRFFGSLDQLQRLTVSGGFSVSDSSNISLLVTELAPDPATGKLTPGGVADNLLGAAAVLPDLAKDVAAIKAQLATLTTGGIDEAALAQHLADLLVPHLAPGLDPNVVAEDVANTLARRLAAGTVPQGATGQDA